MSDDHFWLGPDREIERSKGYLTNAEEFAMWKITELVNVMANQVIGAGPTRDADLREFAGHVHAIQNMIMSQPLARKFPEQFRLLGRTISDSEPAISLKKLGLTRAC